MVEVILALGVVMLVAGIGIAYFRDLSEAARRQAALADLDVLRGEVHRWQVERRSAYGARVPPVPADGKAHVDPWGNPYRILLARRLVYSVGSDGVDETGSGDDVGLTYDPLAGATQVQPPIGFRVADSGPDHVRLAWNPARDPSRVLGYNVYRRESIAQSTYSTVPLNPVPMRHAESPSFTDTTVVPGQVYYYALEVVGSDGTAARASGQVGFQLTSGAR